MPAAIVTGGDSGIGRATAKLLAERGWDVGITHQADGDGGGAFAARVMELTQTQTIAPVIRELAAELGGLDCFVNNAGGPQFGAVLDITEADWRAVLEVNLTGAFVGMQAAARLMCDAGRGGRIIATTSIHEHVPLAESAGYVAAKHGLGGLVKTMAYELAPHAITVNAVAPGEIDVHDRGGTREWIPLGRLGEPREVAELVAFLASEGAGYITGASLVVDGGLGAMGAIANQKTG